jgi:hypothetical protein
MDKRTRSLPKRFEPVAGLDRNCSAREAAERDRVFDEWNRRLGERLPFTVRELLRHGEYLLNRPNLIEGRYAPVIFPIIQLWRAKTARPKRTTTAEEIAGLVDWVIETEHIRQPSRAYEKVAKAYKMTFEAVKKSHDRYGKVKRDKS